jgi:hypothetical protein
LIISIISGSLSIYLGFKSYLKLKELIQFHHISIKELKNSNSNDLDLFEKDYIENTELKINSCIYDFAKCILHSLIDCNEINPNITENDIVLNERDNNVIRTYLDNASKEDSNLFSYSLKQIFIPIKNQRYAVQRYEVKKEYAEKILDIDKLTFKNLIKNVKLIDSVIPDIPDLTNLPTMMVSYNPLPEVFNTKHKAIIFQKNWNKFISPGNVVYLKGEKGLEVLKKFGRSNSLEAKSLNIEIWK